ncbi:MAG: DUF2905 domain-containing protein [candidate division WOR-3 bacterium]|nr:MAG: DUF2905 domain-containing protein [candidate division WOR-3 bacterium]
MTSFAKFFIILGIIFVVVGFLFLIFPKMHFFKLPGDIVIKKDNFVFIFPIVTSIVISIILTIILNFIIRR